MTTSLSIAIPAEMRADFNLALDVLGHGGLNVSAALYRDGLLSYYGAHVWDTDDGYLAQRWSGLPTPPSGSWADYGLTDKRIRDMKSAVLYQIADATDGTARFTDFCRVNNLVWLGMITDHLTIGSIPAGAYYQWPIPGALSSRYCYCILAHQRTADADPATEPTRFRVL